MLGKHPMNELPLSIFPGPGSWKHLHRSIHLRQGKHGAFPSLIREPGPPTSPHNTTNTNSISKWPQHSTPTLTIVVTGLWLEGAKGLHLGQALPGTVRLGGLFLQGLLGKTRIEIHHFGWKEGRAGEQWVLSSLWFTVYKPVPGRWAVSSEFPLVQSISQYLALVPELWNRGERAKEAPQRQNNKRPTGILKRLNKLEFLHEEACEGELVVNPNSS